MAQFSKFKFLCKFLIVSSHPRENSFADKNTMGGRMGGWVDGWMGGRVGLRNAYSNQKSNLLEILV